MVAGTWIWIMIMKKLEIIEKIKGSCISKCFSNVLYSSSVDKEGWKVEGALNSRHKQSLKCVLLSFIIIIIDCNQKFTTKAISSM